MKINLTKQEFTNTIHKMQSKEIVDWLETEGVEFDSDLPELEIGVYRREIGEDLIYYNGTSWKRWDPDCHSNVRIVWTLDSYRPDYWVHILTYKHKPVVGGLRVLFDDGGNRIG